MNTAIKYSLYTVIAFGILFVAFIAAQTPQDAIANPSSVQLLWMTKGGGSATTTRMATTTTGVTYMTTATATSTMPLLVNGVDQVNVNVRLTPSTTATNLLAKIEYANGALCDTQPTACDWFDASGVTVNSNISSTIGSTTVVYNWKPDVAANSTTTASFAISNINASYMRLGFQLVGANGAIWVETAQKVQNN